MARFLRYCVRCLLPETKPDLSFDAAGVCSACTAYDRRASVDWDARRRELLTILDRYRRPDSYDCIVPVSGGKDSHAQVIRMLEFGMTPLAVTATTDHLTDIGRRNLNNLQRLGVDHIEVTINPIVRRRMNRLALTQVGDISWPEHVAIFTIPVRIACQMGVPLIIWGENSQDEYGGPAAAQDSPVLTRRWLEEFGGLLGLRVSDLVGQEGIERRHLIQMTYPTDGELAAAGVTGLFLGHFEEWDGLANAYKARDHGFEWWDHDGERGEMVEGSGYRYENLDNAQTGIHDYFKYLKYGFGRCTDITSLHIRRGRVQRWAGLEHVRQFDGRFPWTYLGVPIGDILEEIGMTPDEFQRTCHRFTNRAVFRRDEAGDFLLRYDRSPAKINDDNVADATGDQGHADPALLAVRAS